MFVFDQRFDQALFSCETGTARCPVRRDTYLKGQVVHGHMSIPPDARHAFSGKRQFMVPLLESDSVRAAAKVKGPRAAPHPFSLCGTWRFNISPDLLATAAGPKLP